MKKILVTGGTGYIGSHTCVELIQAGYEVEIIDNLCNSKIGVLDKIAEITGVKPKFHEVDIRDYEGMLEIFKSTKYDSVIHFAGLKAVGESVEKPLEYYETNIGGTINLLKCMKETGVEEIIFSSSATVYGDPGVEVYVETLETGRGITNPYGRTKYMIEEILKDVCVSDKNFSAVILRYFNPVGAHRSGLLGEDPNGRPNNLMPIIMKVKKGEISELSVYGNDYPTPDGTCIRDYIHVVDLAKGHIAALASQKAAGTPGISIYNLGTGRGTSVLEMISAFESASGERLPYSIAPRRAGDLASMHADPKKAETDLGWRAELTIRDAMEDTLRFLKNN